MVCAHCGETFEQHEVRGDQRWCRDGERLDVEFQASTEVIDFIRANPGKTSKELAALWIERLRGRKL